ncbi:MAG: hypothetical protein IJ533_01255 [Prevotella sp.]|nr:hypothetical protein [Prevotella sp.]
MLRRFLPFVLTAMVVAVQAQSVVSTHWALDKTIKDLAAGSAAYNEATASTISCEGTDVSKMLETHVAFGAHLAFQATITPSSYATHSVTGLQMLRFKTQGAADGTDDYGMTLSIRPTGELTYVPTRVSLTVASWLKNSNTAFEVLVRKLNAAGEVSQTYEVGTVKSHTDASAEYDDVSFDVPADATASADTWQVVVRMAKGYNNGTNLAMGNVTLVGNATLGGTVQTSQFTATVVPEGAGTVSPAQTSVVTGDNVTCTATPNIGYAFEGWYVGGTQVSAQNPHTFNIAADTQVEARFTKLPEATLTYGTATPSMGTVTVSEQGDGGKYNAGTKLTLTATAAKGHYFVSWTDADGTVLSTAAKYTFTLDTDQTVYAVFAMIHNYRADIASFPGAEGYGRFTTGGRMTDNRGAKVYYVTRTDDCPDNALVEGTLRWALKTGDDTPRTILFRTCGTIYLTSKLSLNHPNITIAGQTAPGGGICIAGYQMKLNQPNIIIRHIRFRTGDLPASSMSPLDVENTHHIVLDHCSFSWSMEENLTLYDTDSTTLQWCISAEGLYESKNVKGERSYAMQWGGEHGTMHHCLVSNCMSRMPRFNGARPSTNDRQVDNEFANNVIFNWGSHNSIYGGECTVTGENDYDRVYMLNNYYRPGPATKTGAANRRYFVSATGDNINEVGQWYLSGNKFELSSKWSPSTNIWTNAELQKVNQDNYYGFIGDNASRAMNFWSVSPSQALADKALLKELPYALSGLQYETADEAYKAVVAGAGASLPRYDEVDRRLLDEAAGLRDPEFHGATFVSTKNGSTITPAAGIINSPSDLTLSRYDEFYALDEATGQTVKTQMWPWLGMDDDEQLMTDTDQDGMPDDYELSAGLNPNDATDGYLLTESGYSNLEVFLNGVADGTIDLQPYKKAKAAEKRVVFNATVSPTDVAADFQTIGAAISDAEQKATKDAPYYIFVKAGTYNEHVEITKPYIHLTGQSRDLVVITDNKSKSYNGDLGKTATVYVNTSDVSLDNLTINNTYGSGEQALALYTLGDRITVTQCRINGWQDTYRTGKSGQRHLVRECTISGTTDFIYNAGDVFFDRDTLQLTNSTNVITAPSHISPTWGYVFRDAYIKTLLKSMHVDTDLGRPWGDTPKVTFIDTRLAGNVFITPEGWRDMDGLPTQMAEYNTTDAAGQAVDLSQRKTTFKNDKGETATSKAVLTAAEAAAYTLQNVLSGTDQWEADAAGRILAAPQMTVADGRLSWSDATGQAACYLVITNGQATLTTDEQMAYDGSSAVSVQSVSQHGVLGRPVTPATATAIRQQPTVSQQPAAVYNLQGQRLSQPLRGISVSSGKKYLKK